MMKAWIETDVLVIGAGAAGWPAAIGAARSGVKVVLLDDDPYPGGAAVDQFVSMPDGGPLSGVVTEYLAQLEKRFALTDRPIDKWWYFWYLPSDILRVVGELLAAETNLKLLCSAKASRLTLDGSRVTGAIVPDVCGRERWIKAKTVIEATGTGALAEAAGCEACYGEDSRADFGEAIAPSQRTPLVQQCTWMYVSHRLPGGDSQWVPRGLESGFCAPPSNTDPGAIARQAGTYLHWGCRVDCRDTRDPIALADAQREGLQQMAPHLDELRAHGYVVHLAPKIGVREQRRILGEHVVTANDMIEGRIPEDAILVTQRPIDIWKKGGHGMMDYPEIKPYGIPYRALVPRHVDGLLVAGKHMSGTHLAMASYRVQSLLGQIGQAAGVAAALCAKGDVQPRRLVFGDLKPQLLGPPQNLVIRSDPEWVAPAKG
jgi:2-polyprenyl-6-methoxyphenol hydroxylase-like FAD-dependent oxidoreductase